MGFADPRFIADDFNATYGPLVYSLLEKMLKDFVESNQLERRLCDPIRPEFREFYDLEISRDKLSCEKFDHMASRLDCFYTERLAINPAYAHFWKFLKTCLPSSHGQTSVERRFSVNKQVVENQTQESLIAQRFVIDYPNSIGGIENVSKTSKMRFASRNARKTFHIYTCIHVYFFT